MGEPTTHLIITHAVEGVFAFSPQLPGFSMGRSSAAEFADEYKQVLYDVGVRGLVKAHHERHFWSSSDIEFAIRHAEDGLDDRVEVSRRLQLILIQAEDRILEDLPPLSTGERLFVCCLAADVLGDIRDELEAGDIVTLATAAADNGLALMTLGVGVDDQHASWHTLNDFDLTPRDTVGKMLSVFASRGALERPAIMI